MADDIPSGKGKESVTYEAGCHCGYIKFDVTFSPGLDEYPVAQCNCSACTRFGYLLVYPEAKDIVWHNDSRERCGTYRFNTKEKDQLFCPQCGASIGIDFRDIFKPHKIAISVRSIYDIDLEKLVYKKIDGKHKTKPAGDLSGHYWDEEKQEMK